MLAICISRPMTIGSGMLILAERSQPAAAAVWMLVALVSFGAVSGCEEGGYFSQTEQTYTITVTGTSGNLVRSTTVTLTVE